MRALLALFVRALRQTTRAPSTYLLRAFIASALLFCLWVTHEEMRWAGAAGRTFFSMLIAGNYLLLTLVGLGSFASAIAEEKEEGSLALLRMTNLSPLGMLLGKSTSRLWVVFLLLATQLPFAFLAVTLGGVSRTQIFTGYGLLASYLFLFANITLFFSVVAPRSALAALLSLGFAGGASLVCVAPFMLASWLTERRGWQETNETIQTLRFLSDWCFSIHPVTHMAKVVEGRFLSLEVGRSIAIHLAGGVFFFVLALLAFERFCGNEAAYTKAGGTRARRLGWLRRPGRARLYGVAWKDFHFMLGGKLGVIIRLAAYFTAILCIARFDDYAWTHDLRRLYAELAWIFGWLFFWIEVAFGALRMWGPEAWGLQLGSLIATPRSLRRITFEKIRALLISLLPVTALLVSGLVIGGSEFARPSIHSFWNWLTSSYEWEELGLSSAIAMIPGALLGLVEIGLPILLIVNISLRLKWTALPTAIGVYLLLQAAFGMTVSAISVSWMTSVVAEAPCKLTLFAVLLFFLFRNTRTLLLRRAAEG